MIKDGSSQSLAGDEAVACPDCDLLQLLPELPPGARASCARCGCTLAARAVDPLDRPLALTLAALPVLIVANALPLMGLSAAGRHASTTILGGAAAMWHQGQEPTALVVAFCATLAPGAYLLLLLAILLAARRLPVPLWVGPLLRWAEWVQAWSMVEVMMLGVLVALIKIAQLATVEPGIGMYAVGVLMLLLPVIQTSLDLEAIWQRLRWRGSEPPPGERQAP